MQLLIHFNSVLCTSILYVDIDDIISILFHLREYYFTNMKHHYHLRRCFAIMMYNFSVDIDDIVSIQICRYQRDRYDIDSRMSKIDTVTTFHLCSLNCYTQCNYRQYRINIDLTMSTIEYVEALLQLKCTHVKSIGDIVSICHCQQLQLFIHCIFALCLYIPFLHITRSVISCRYLFAYVYCD